MPLSHLLDLLQSLKQLHVWQYYLSNLESMFLPRFICSEQYDYRNIVNLEPALLGFSSDIRDLG